jgi:Protein of unknown function (DUF4236)
MGMFFRKSVKLGPIRLNFSKSGVGVSAGIRGLRAGVSSQGKTYIAGGRYGMYFRHTLSDSGPDDRTVEAGGHWLACS